MILGVLRCIGSVVKFEGRRSVTFSRLMLWLLLGSFPVAIVSLIQWTAGPQNAQGADQVWQVLIMVLTLATLALSVLLWAAPAVQIELENRTWVYTAVRPYGRRSVLLGRYLVAVGWASSCNALSATIACLVTGQSNAILPLIAVTLLGASALASLHSLVAVMFPKRAMAVAFGVTVVLEAAIGFIPAMIREFSIQFHLRCLMHNWLWKGTDISRLSRLFNESSSGVHVATLIAYAIVLLGLAVWILESRELPTDDV